MNFPPGNLVGLLAEPHDAAFVRHVVEGVLKQLASYHERGRSYGQVRPDTVYLAADGRVRLGDVRATIVSTQVEAPEGLSKYLPPETLAADVFGEVGPATDIYALGMVAIELLVGPRFESLFEGIADDPLGGDLAWMRWHGTPELRLPPVREIVPSIDAGLAAAIDRMIAKHVAERPGTAQQVLALLAGGEAEAEAFAPPSSSAPAQGDAAAKSQPPAEVPREAEPEPPAVDLAGSHADVDASVRKTQDAATAATIYYDDTETHVDGAAHGLEPLPVWQDDVRATPRVTDTAREEPPAAPPIAPSPNAEPAPHEEESSWSEPARRSAQPVRGTMMPDEDDSTFGRPVAAAAKAQPSAPEARRPKPASTPVHPADHLPPAMKLAMKKRRGPLEHPVVLLLLSAAIIAAVGYLLFVVWPADDGTRTVEIRSDPPGAAISVDGVASGERTPAKIKLKIGKHDLRATLDGHYDAKKSVEIAEDNSQPPVLLELTKIPTVRVVRLETQPADAEIYLDDNPVPLGSRTPAEVTLSLGRHTLVFKKAGYVDTKAEVDVVLGDGAQAQRATLSPVPKRMERVVVKVDPADARLTVGGKAVAAAGGQATVEVEEGSPLEITASAADFADWKQTVSFDELKASRFTVVAELDPFISFVPPEAAVKVNDAPLPLDAGRARIAAKSGQQLHIVATAKGYGTLDVTVSRSDLASRSFRFELPPGPRPPATLREVAAGRYVHDELDKAGAPLYFVVVEPGDFVFGAARDGIRNGELERRTARIDAPFLISTTEVSVRQYAIFADKAGEAKAGTRWRPADLDSAAKLPVTNVSHQQAMSFAEFVGGTLPTEKQWERAARGTKGRIYPWADDDEPSAERCNLGFGPIGQGKLAAVDALPGGATPEGLLNMLGNAAEWCEDTYEAGHRDIEDRTPGTRVFPTIRGGSYLEPYNSTSRNARTTMRQNKAPNGGADVGFRVVVPFTDGK